MEKKSDILNELQTISPLLAGIGKVNVFRVPDGYFDSISDTVIFTLTEDFSVDNNLFASTPSDVPEGYFENLSQSVLDKIKNQKELLEPGNEADELLEILSRLNKENIFTIPENYFEELADSVINLIKISREELIDEEETLPDVLQHLKNVQPYNVPLGYFADLPANILNKIRQQSGAKIITMPKRFSIFRYAAAAVITGALALGVYKYSNQPLVNITNAVASVQLDPSIEKGKVMDDKKFNETLNNLSADEIVNYLQRNSSEADVAVLSSNVEETSLPNEDDYLLDDKTLDNFLKDLETKTN
jgi:hypothetical protein